MYLEVFRKKGFSFIHFLFGMWIKELTRYTQNRKEPEPQLIHPCTTYLSFQIPFTSLELPKSKFICNFLKDATQMNQNFFLCTVFIT